LTGGECVGGHAQAFAGVGVVGADLHAGEFGERNFFGGIVEQNQVQCVAGILRANQARESHGHAFWRA